jgi:hypothetical protein
MWLQQELIGILALSPILPSISPQLIRMTARALDVPQLENQGENFKVPDSLAAQVFGKCVKALADLPSHDWPEHVPSWTTRAVKRWQKCEIVLSGLVAVSKQYVHLLVLHAMLMVGQAQICFPGPFLRHLSLLKRMYSLSFAAATS